MSSYKDLPLFANQNNSNVPEFTVSEFSNNMKRVVEDSFGYVRIKGEVSGFKKAASGHVYFSLKDENSVLSAVCFKGAFSKIDFEVEDGMELVASGKITIYAGRSNYQIIVEKLEIAGIGALMEAIEKRRKKLLAEGLFDQKHKKPLPFWPLKIGIITSQTGTVIEDIKHRIEDRFPTHLILYPVTVQGKNAANEVIEGIRYFNESENKPDIIIIARGGGSFEDLLPFNDEALAREVFKSQIVIISAVGHETDTTIIDYVSDVRAPTPSAAAEMATPVLSDLKLLVDNLGKRMGSYTLNFLSTKRDYLQNLSKYLIHPKKKLEQSEQRIGELGNQLKINLVSNIRRKEQELKLSASLLTKPTNVFDNHNQKLSFLIKTINQTVSNQLQKSQSRIEMSERLLNSYHYKKVLNRGYALIRSEDQQIISGASLVENGQKINIEMSDGNFDAIARK